MTTITMPQAKDTAPVMAIIAVALAPLILGLAVALGAITAPAPVQSPATMTNQANSDDPTPNSGLLEFAD
jgi:hypothetical protein